MYFASGRVIPNAAYLTKKAMTHKLVIALVFITMVVYDANRIEDNIFSKKGRTQLIFLINKVPSNLKSVRTKKLYIKPDRTKIFALLHLLSKTKKTCFHVLS